MKRYRVVFAVAVMSFVLGAAASNASATLLGTVPTLPGDTVFPGLVAPGTPPGTLLASLTVPFVDTLGTDAGTVVSAVYRESGGTLDFYYQVASNLTAPNCGTAGKPACDPISRQTDTSFFGSMTSLGFRTDGGSLSGGLFVNGAVAPVIADRNSVGNVVGFSFFPPDSAKIQPGQTSDVLVISTDATNFTAGHASVINGGTTTVASFQPVSAVPEPGSMLLLGTGVLGLVGMRRRVRR